MQIAKNPTREDLEALMELPINKTRDALIESKHWDWSQDPEYGEYEVTVTATVELEVYATTTVWAKSADDARREIQNKKKTRDFSWEDDGWSSWDIDSWDVDEVNFIKPDA